ncbi:hypothetical protein NDU88_003765 [Pleurodeles waltl]|uniref:Uncharacterized protein n=1 Tax=Pleurodeles waltl TaxID=8319 RepID=A0AAV7RJG7_PLEWA|nr:hypothetical protein NDU88_003765 [Pleurodeles waltl]
MDQALTACYQDLYLVDPSSPHEDLPQFVQDLPVLSLSSEDRESLEVDITVEELRKALAQLQPGKAPGHNGFPPEYWSISEALRKGELPPDLRTADTVVLSKPNLDCTWYGDHLVIEY